MDNDKKNGTVTVILEGRADAKNAQSLENEILGKIEQSGADEILFDAKKLEYISSAGIRVLIKVQNKLGKKIRLINVSRDVYDVLEKTGCTELFEVKRALRRVSIEGCELIGKGGHGNVYRLDSETIIKVYHDNSTLSLIDREREYARNAFIHGVSTAIAFDTVETEEGYGVVFEMAGGITFGQYILGHPEKLREYSEKFAALIRSLNSAEADPVFYTETKQQYLERLGKAAEYFTAEENGMLEKLVNSVPDGSGMVHGDFHTDNVLIKPDGELILIDMADVTRGSGLFDISGLFVMKWMSELYRDPSDLTVQVVGPDADVAVQFRNIALSCYFDTSDKEKLESLESICDALSLLKMAALLGTVPPGSGETASPIVGILRKYLFPKVQEYCDLLDRSRDQLSERR